VDTVLEWRSVLGEPATTKLMGENAMRFLRLASTPWDTVNGSTSQTIKSGAPASSGI
jgi:hypothetical protein